MTRRSTPQARLDDLTFAVAVKVIVPTTGFGTSLSEMHQFLNEVVGSENFANHPGRTMGIEQASTFYFRDLEAAMMFRGRFRGLVLANRPKN